MSEIVLAALCIYLFMDAAWLVTDHRVGMACDNPYG